MILASQKAFVTLFKVFCVIAAISMVLYWVYKFQVEDRDVGLVDYMPIKEAKDIRLPILSLCFENPFLKEFLTNKHPNINTSAYLDFLRGKTYDKGLKEINYDNVTLKLERYLLFAAVTFRNGTQSMETSTIFRHKNAFNGFYEGRFMKCFSVMIEDADYDRKISQTILFYNHTQLVDDLTGELDGHEVRHATPTPIGYTAVHYLGQFLLQGSEFGQGIFDLMKNKAELTEGSERRSNFYGFRVFIKSIEMLKRRNSQARKCTEEKITYDDLSLRQHISNLGCRPPYHDQNKQYPLCPNEEMVQKVTYEFKDLSEKYYPKSCKRISKMDFNLYKNPVTKFGLSTMMFGLQYPEEIKIITQSKEVDVHSLIGNIGGYIGLFLGNLLNMLLIIPTDNMISAIYYQKLELFQICIIRMYPRPNS